MCTTLMKVKRSGKGTKSIDVTFVSGLAKVYCALDKQTGKKVAIKAIRITAKNLKYILPELMNHKACHHPNVVEFLGAYFLPDKRQIWVALEYMSRGSVAQLLEPAPPKFEPVAMPEPKIAYVCREVLKALSYIHGMNRIHRDIKSDNVRKFKYSKTCRCWWGKILKSSWRISVCSILSLSFTTTGFAVQLTEKRKNRKTIVGTPYWMVRLNMDFTDSIVRHLSSLMGIRMRRLWTFGLWVL